MKSFLFLLMLWDWIDNGTYAQDALHESESESVYEVFAQLSPPTLHIEAP